ncbi:C1 family peptidase [Tumebacillus sp. ITR2]|uniref:C1 family peptidase n=2 Tax=Tumebacillus amylolyticus TaxID=2801339 RepID=A0ABS1JFN6_9BACL|nr:C1 family peptidase [Tumebacillus amylolyticus]
MFRTAIFNTPEALPKAVDLRDKCSPVVDQGQLGSCTANAMASGLREYLLLRSGQPFTPLSRLFLYWHEREMEGSLNEDAGAQIRDGMKVLNKVGVCPEADYPYAIDHFKDKPTSQAEKDAALYRIGEYHRIASLSLLKAALAQGLPVVIGFAVYDSFESKEVAATGIVPMPDAETEQMLGGHAVLAVGYDDEGGHVIIRNSWGEGWGDEGNCYFPYEMWDYNHILQSPIVFDMWTGH